jgi:hypothetical protein
MTQAAATRASMTERIRVRGPSIDAFESVASAWLAPLDRARRNAFALAGPRLAAWMANRERRVALYGASVIVGALVLATVLPLWSLALGPIVLGVPHLLVDVRYLWMRPGFHRRLGVWLAVAAPVAVGAITGRSAWGFAACLGAVAIARDTSMRRRVAVAIGAAVLLALAIVERRAVDLAFAHAHNLVALALWWAWRPRATKAHVVLLALFVAASLAIGFGLVLPMISSGPDSWAAHAFALAPFASPAIGIRIVILFAFAQSVHYGVWLRLVPEEDRTREAPRSFASSLRALRADVGLPILAIASALAMSLAIWAAFDVVAARAGYLRFAGFHGELELAAAALFFLERRNPSPRTKPCSAGS